MCVFSHSSTHLLLSDTGVTEPKDARKHYTVRLRKRIRGLELCTKEMQPLAAVALMQLLACAKNFAARAEGTPSMC
jgi:hypothetical protein